MPTITKEEIQHKIDFKTKPVGALGQLEQIALQICLVQQTSTPQLRAPQIIVFAADHGLAKNGVSAYPQDVTWQMVLNFLQGGAAINVFSKQHNIGLHIVDAGVNKDLSEHQQLIHAKAGNGTQNSLHEAAITAAQYSFCKEKASAIVKDVIAKTGTNIIGFGEMGIGNTAAASLLMHAFTGHSIETCTGRGTGVTDEQLQHKIDILKQVLAARNCNHNDVHEVLKNYGGFEIVMMCYAMLAAYENNCLIMIDGFIATSAYAAALKINPDIKSHAISCHQSHEQGHQLLLHHVQATPILQLNMRLGEGTGCAVAYPIIASAVAFINDMASFESANVSNKA